MITKEEVLKVVCEEFGVTDSQILSKSRIGRLPEARHLTCLILSRYFGPVKIGDLLGCDHSSVIRNCRQIAYRIDVDPACAASYNNILQKLHLPYSINMKIEFEQLKGLQNLLGFFLDGFVPRNDMEQILKNNLTSIYEKVRKKVIFKKTNITLNPNEQLSFRHWQQHLHLLPQIDEFNYEANVARVIVQQIKVEYG